MTFDEAVAKGSPRILRNLKIDEVSSVTSGAGRGVRVVLAKHHPLNKEATMATVRCPKCGHEDTAEKFAKGAANAAPDHEVIAKAVSVSHESIARDLMKDDPTLSFQKAMTKALDTPQFSQLHRDEKMARHGAGF